MTRFSLPSQLRTPQHQQQQQAPNSRSPSNPNSTTPNLNNNHDPRVNDGPRVNPARRRNGKPPSCEPCRRGKLRCDHVLPTCARCVRRGTAAKCVYHPAPLTRVRGVRGVEAAGTRRGAAAPATPSPSPPQLLSQSQPQPQPQPQPLAATGFLGSTSYAAVLAEHEEDGHQEGEEGREDEEDEEDGQAISTPASNNSNNDSFFHSGEAAATRPPAPPAPPAPNDRIAQGAEVLALLQDLPVFERFIDRWYSVSGGGIITSAPLLKQWTEALWAAHGDVLLQQQQTGSEAGAASARLGELSARVWWNSRGRLTGRSARSVREWAASTSGWKLRWEVVGVTMAVVGLSCSVLPDWDPLLGGVAYRYGGRRGLIKKLSWAADSCLAFCESLCLLNDVGVWLMFEAHALFVYLHGEASYTSYQRSGHVFNALIALGWHQPNQHNNQGEKQKQTYQQPAFFLAEQRTRLFAAAYAHDKWQAAYLGRPPRLSHRYCAVGLPLDVSDHALLADEPGVLARELEALDEGGWGRERGSGAEGGGGGRRAWARAWVAYCRVREDILEFSIGTFDSEGDVVGRARQIEAQATATWDALPAHLRADDDPAAAAALASAPPVECLYLVFIRLESLHNEFLLWRAVLRHTASTITTTTTSETRATASTKMLLAAQKLLDGVVAAAGRGELCLAFQDAWTMLTSPGLPAACAVAAELVRLHKHEYTHTSCSRLPSSSPANADGSNAGHSPLNRSHAIQSLAVYLAALARIPPLDPAARICKRGKAFLAKALEHVLGGSGPGPLPHRPPTEGSAAAASGEEAGVEGSADTNAAARTASIEVEGAREAVPARDELPLWTADLDAFGFGDDYDVLGLGELGWVGGSGSGWGFGEDGGMVW